MKNVIRLSGNEADFLVASPGARCSFRPPATPYIWPKLNQLALSDEEIAERCSGIGGSDSNTLLSGDRERVLRLWRQKRGQAPEEDLSNVLRVALGRWTEHFKSTMVRKGVGSIG